MTLVNLLITLIFGEFMILMASFPTMIETARKASRDARMHSFRDLVGDDRTTQLADFIEGFYFDNRVVFLKMIKGVMLTVVLSAAVFWGFSYYISAYVIPRLINTAKNSGLDNLALGTLGASFNELPNMCLILSCFLVVLVFFTFSIIGFIFELPRDLRHIIKP